MAPGAGRHFWSFGALSNLVLSLCCRSSVRHNSERVGRGINWDILYYEEARMGLSGQTSLL